MIRNKFVWGLFILLLAFVAMPTFAGEADIHLPDLSQVTFEGLGGAKEEGAVDLVDVHARRNIPRCHRSGSCKRAVRLVSSETKPLPPLGCLAARCRSRYAAARHAALQYLVPLGAPTRRLFSH